MSTCQSCLRWVTQRRRAYSDGTEITVFTAPVGKGMCELLSCETAPDFGCNGFVADPGSDHIAVETIAGAPWSRFCMGKCPECNGRGSGIEGGACGRCVGTGHVRYYDDGYIGEERTRRHPSEPAVEAVVDPGTILQPLEKPSVL